MPTSKEPVEDDDEWTLINKDSIDGSGSLVEEIASFSSADDGLSIEVPEKQNETRGKGSTPTSSNSGPDTRISDANIGKPQSVSPIASANPGSSPMTIPTNHCPRACQQSYVLSSIPIRQNGPSTQTDPSFGIPRTAGCFPADPNLYQRFPPHLTPDEIEDWIQKCKRAHDVAYIGEGVGISMARNYSEFLAEFPTCSGSSHQHLFSGDVTTKSDPDNTDDLEDPEEDDSNFGY